MSRTTLAVWLGLIIVTSLLLEVLSFRVRKRVNDAHPQERWGVFSNHFHDWHRWQTYRDEAPDKGWPVWPYYIYIAVTLEWILLLVAAFLLGFPAK